MFGFGFFEGLFADNFDGGDFAIFKVLNFIASSESSLAEELSFLIAANDGAIGFVGTLFDDLGFVGLSVLFGESWFLIGLGHFLIVYSELNL